MQDETKITYSPKTGVTAAKGFRAAGIHCGIKKVKKDLALIFTDSPATAAGVFTLNKVQAAPVVVSKEHLKRSKKFHAIIVNSGNANACTGEQGFKDAVFMAVKTAEVMKIKPEEVFVSSTGVIGETLPMEKISAGIGAVANSLDKDINLTSAEAIITTDTFIKTAAESFDVKGKTVTIGGISKGSGMIHPNMATMLAFVTTDAAIDGETFQIVLKEVSDKTFNRIVVDGDTSTNDMVIALANGESGIDTIKLNSEEYNLFSKSLYNVLKKLSVDIVRDGEGATKLVEINVEGALNDKDAEKAARQVALSPLVKTAIHGEDANWGRILAAVGYSGIEFDPDKFEIIINGTTILGQNYFVTLPIEQANQTLKSKEIEITLKLNCGDGKATVWTCDFSEEYVKINGSYRS
jgi:glutamate N-acetyltransferase / amino-acid N-acetyltransferase